MSEQSLGRRELAVQFVHPSLVCLLFTAVIKRSVDMPVSLHPLICQDRTPSPRQAFTSSRDDMLCCPDPQYYNILYV